MLEAREMKHRRSWVAGLGALVVACSVNAFAAKSLADYSGEEIFARFCASCHGDTAHGNGPVARSLGVMVPDLTKIAQHYGGFPTQLVRDTIDGRGALIAAHGTRPCPCGGMNSGWRRVPTRRRSKRCARRSRSSSTTSAR